MKNNEVLWEICGHERIKFSHICVSNWCKSASRLMCVECVKKNNHNHDIEFYMTFTEFLEYFRNERLPQLEFRVQQQKGNQVKCYYLQKIYEEFSELDQDYNILNLKVLLKHINIKQTISDYINKLKNEITQAQEIYDIFQQLTLDNLNNVNNIQIDYLLQNNCQFFEKEIQSQQKIHILINNFKSISSDKFNSEFLQNALQKVRSLSKKLEKLDKYINFKIHDSFFQECHSSRDQLYESGRYLAQYQQYYFKKQEKLFIRDLISKKLIKQHIFKSQNEKARIQFDNKWKYFVTANNAKLFYYVLQRNHQIKQIKKFNSEDRIDHIELININKIMITTLNNEQQIQIIDFQLRKRNVYRVYDDKEYIYLLYGRQKQIIVAQVKDSSKKTLYSIYIYNESVIKPFIIGRDYSKACIRSGKFFNQDSQLLACSKGKDIYSWQINYVDQKLILQKIMKHKEHQDYFYELSQLYVIKKSRGQIEILDQNFNLWFTIKLKKPNDQAERVHISNQTLLYQIEGFNQPDLFNYIVLTRALCNYEQLKE